MMFKDAAISNDGKYRYKLTRRWDMNLSVVNFIMLNPSTADAETDDATIRKCIGFTKNWGYGGFHVTNLNAFRSRNPDEMFEHYEKRHPIIDAFSVVIDLDNTYIKNVASISDVVVCAWGCNKRIIDRATYVQTMLYNMIGKDHVKWKALYCIAKSKDGYPKHPVYLPYTDKPVRYI